MRLSAAFRIERARIKRMRRSVRRGGIDPDRLTFTELLVVSQGRNPSDYLEDVRRLCGKGVREAVIAYMKSIAAQLAMPIEMDSEVSDYNYSSAKLDYVQFANSAAGKQPLTEQNKTP